MQHKLTKVCMCVCVHLRARSREQHPCVQRVALV
jgi:hypothetical protein